MDKCAICHKPAVQLFETGKEGSYACFKCQPLVPEVTIGDSVSEHSEPSSSKSEEAHLRNHRAERRFVCTFCNKAFSQSNNLRAHLRIHTNERPYKCNDCGKAFTQVTNLNNHVRLHTGERPFVCPEPGCNKAYAQVTNLNQHRKRHLNGGPVETSYDCTVCGQQFQQRNHMYTHRRSAHNAAKRSPQHLCKLCELGFPSERLLQEHVAHHVEPTTPKSEYTCVFSTCGMQFTSPREHTEHLLRAHQLRVLARHHRAPAKRGRPPKLQMLKDPLDLKDSDDSVYEVEIIKPESPRPFLPKLKVQSLFQ